MAQTTGISWTDATWNPWHGCRKISAGCKYCYMFRDKERYGQDPTVVMRSKSNFNDPLKWAMDTEQIGFLPGKDKEPSAFVGMKIFTCSWSDFFIQEADEWRADAWNIIRDTPEFTYQILTKRPERIMECLPPDWGRGYENVWLGVSVEDKEKLFLPYFSTKERGTGLGLAIVSRIVSEHEGVVRVEENRPVGTRFIVELPIPAA